MGKKNRMMKAAIALSAVAVLGISGIANAKAYKPSQHTGHATSAKTKNVILFVGDGMGAAQRDAIRLASTGLSGDLEMNKMPYTGVVHTSSTSVVTDSAAAATAMASGVKTYNGAIGVDANKVSKKTVLEEAKQAGKATGLVTTSQITDATPAAFGAHVKNRSEQSKIAKQYLENSKVDVLLGGGEDYWYPKGSQGAYEDHPAKDPSEASKGTEGNLVSKAKRLGYQYVTNASGLKKAGGNKLLGLFANEEMFEQREEGQGDQYDPVVSLPEMTKKAISTLSKNKNGFFLMVEEEAIDEMAHENNASQLIKAGRQLDHAVKVAKDYAKKHPDTLVLVLADHDCGGMTVESADNSDESGDGISKEDGPFQVAGSSAQFVVDWTTSGHTAVDIPLTAIGSGASLFEGTYENTYIHDALLRAMGLKK
ncbi:alkaline phosphatase [Heyndrickxia coagulans]|uniref:Alkaline phosphatase n=1 Tax=Heyndrickxia coagulans TaxID=1398 RepID=A0AAW7CG12_HEYCO|nr:alkaline phosphatase [Heyndrickxia coagulans]MDL5041643.1 alkaline phosphatase [Heyndrickxia coagulans]